MDHRVSKDMISNGMTPSGEKSQEDLGRTQYGSTPSPNSLFDAYKSIYEHHKKDADGNTIPHEGEELNEAIPLIGAALAGAGKLVAGLGAKAAATGAGKAIAGAAAKKGIGAAAKKGTMMVGKQLGGTQGARIGAKAADAFGKMDNFSKVQVASMAKDTVGNTLNAVNPLKKRAGGTGGGGVSGGMSQTVSAGADLFDIVKGQLLDEGLSEEEIRDIMLTLTPDEILKEIEESSLSAGSSGGHYSDGGDGVFRSKQQVANMFNKNIPASKNGKVDKPTRKAINTSAKDFGIQGPSTLKQSVEPEGETI